MSTASLEAAEPEKESGNQPQLNERTKNARYEAYRCGDISCSTGNHTRQHERRYCQCSGTLKLKIGTEGAYPPFNFIKPDGTLSGFDVDIARALCDEMKAECEFVTQEWDGAIPALQSGKFDAFIASMSITDERKKQVDFSNKYYNTPPGVAAPKDTDIKGVTKEDLAGKTIGVQVSTTHSNYSEKTFTDSTIKAYPTAEEYRLDLANGRLDAVNDDSVTLAEWLKSPDGACCKMVDTFPPVIEIHGPRVPALPSKRGVLS